ncbi:hypothetical protein Pvag_pPag20014 (plasmid) [Pantoea vagans C9-1]|nr:hypothetical protein Pvag_pPag20014 [Pantoea vagans C9-1]
MSIIAKNNLDGYLQVQQLHPPINTVDFLPVVTYGDYVQSRI